MIPVQLWTSRSFVLRKFSIEIRSWSSQVVTPCRVAVGYQSFGGSCCLFLRGKVLLPDVWYPITSHVTTQKTSTWIFIAVNYSSLTEIRHFNEIQVILVVSYLEWVLLRYYPQIQFPTLREEHMLRVFENRVLGRILGPMRDKVREGWKRRHNEELHNLYASPNIKYY